MLGLCHQNTYILGVDEVQRFLRARRVDITASRRRLGTDANLADSSIRNWERFGFPKKRPQYEKIKAYLDVLRVKHSALPRMIAGLAPLPEQLLPISEIPSNSYAIAAHAEQLHANESEESDSLRGELNSEAEPEQPQKIRVISPAEEIPSLGGLRIAAEKSGVSLADYVKWLSANPPKMPAKAAASDNKSIKKKGR